MKTGMTNYEAFATAKAVIEGHASLLRTNFNLEISSKAQQWEGPKGEPIISTEAERQLRELAKDIFHMLGDVKRPNLRVVK